MCFRTQLMAPIVCSSVAGCLFLCLLVGCIGNPPKLDYTYARSALAAAREAGAPKLAGKDWHRAQMAYKRGQRKFRDKEPEEAERYFREAQKHAERAETKARLKRAQGEGF